MALGSGFGTQEVPVFWRISTDKNPNHKTLQIQSDTSLLFSFSTDDNGMLGQTQAPDGVFSPFIATITFDIPYPVTVNVDVLDTASHELLGSTTLELFGLDVFKARVTYPSTIATNPGSHGYIDAMINGNRQTVFGQDYIQQEFYNEDVWTRGSGN